MPTLNESPLLFGRHRHNISKNKTQNIVCVAEFQYVLNSQTHQVSHKKVGVLIRKKRG